MMNALDNVGIFLTKILFGIWLSVLLLRMVLNWHHANYNNPVCLLIGKLTNPVIQPLSKWIPKFKRLDTATLVLALISNMAQWFILILLQTGKVFFLPLLPIAILDLLVQLFQLLMYSLLFMIVLSWINPGVYNPVSEILYTITEPMLRPIRKIIPPIAGFDISPIPAMIAIGVMLVILKSLF